MNSEYVLYFALTFTFGDVDVHVDLIVFSFYCYLNLLSTGCILMRVLMINHLY